MMMHIIWKTLLGTGILLFSFSLFAQDIPTLNIIFKNDSKSPKEVIRVSIPVGKAGKQMIATGDSIPAGGSLKAEILPDTKFDYRSLFITIAPGCHIFICHDKGKQPQVSISEQCGASQHREYWDAKKRQLNINI